MKKIFCITVTLIFLAKCSKAQLDLVPPPLPLSPDVNGFPLNPNWVSPRPIPVINDLCGCCSFISSNCNETPQLDLSSCADPSNVCNAGGHVLYTINKILGASGVDTRIVKLITYEGNLCFQGFTIDKYTPPIFRCEDLVAPIHYEDGDRDISFDILRQDSALYTQGFNLLDNSKTTYYPLHAEFSAMETIALWCGTAYTSTGLTWWTDFRENILNDYCSFCPTPCASGCEILTNSVFPKTESMVNGKFAIVIGGIGFDYTHAKLIGDKCTEIVWAEIHPVFAMFIHVNDNARDDRWAFFVKTFAEDAGGVGQNKLRKQDGTFDNLDNISVIIPQSRKGSTYNPSVAKQNTWFGKMGVNSTDCNDIFPASISSSPASDITTESVPGKGLKLTFKNLNNTPCTERNYYVGEVSIRWGSDEEIGQAAGSVKFRPRQDACTNCCAHVTR